MRYTHVFTHTHAHSPLIELHQQGKTKLQAGACSVPHLLSELLSAQNHLLHACVSISRVAVQCSLSTPTLNYHFQGCTKWSLEDWFDRVVIVPCQDGFASVGSAQGLLVRFKPARCAVPQNHKRMPFTKSNLCSSLTTQSHDTFRIVPLTVLCNPADLSPGEAHERVGHRRISGAAAVGLPPAFCEHGGPAHGPPLPPAEATAGRHRRVQRCAVQRRGAGRAAQPMPRGVMEIPVQAGCYLQAQLSGRSAQHFFPRLKSIICPKTGKMVKVLRGQASHASLAYHM